MALLSSVVPQGVVFKTLTVTAMVTLVSTTVVLGLNCSVLIISRVFVRLYN